MMQVEKVWINPDLIAYLFVESYLNSESEYHGMYVVKIRMVDGHDFIVAACSKEEDAYKELKDFALNHCRHGIVADRVRVIKND